MAKITKKEKKAILLLILGILFVSFLENPVSRMIDRLGVSDFWLIVIGIGVFIAIYKYFDLG